MLQDNKIIKKIKLLSSTISKICGHMSNCLKVIRVHHDNEKQRRKIIKKRKNKVVP